MQQLYAYRSMGNIWHLSVMMAITTLHCILSPRRTIPLDPVQFDAGDNGDTIVRSSHLAKIAANWSSLQVQDEGGNNALLTAERVVR
ncbi:MAG: hypothetical protein Q9P01_11535 [Anaerolineae bacterium]|nr:hypothetical protein [Anaerolineae bacterium]